MGRGHLRGDTRPEDPIGRTRPDSTLGFNQYLHSVARNWWLIVIVAALFAGVTAVITSQAEEDFRARASLTLAPAPALEDSDRQLETLMSLRSQLTTTLAKIVSSGAVLESAGDGAYLDELEGNDLELIAGEVPDSLVVDIIVTGESPEMVGDFLADVADEAIERFEKLYPVAIVEPLDPEPLVEPRRPSGRRRVVVAIFVGLGVGFLLGLLRDALARWRSWKTVGT